MRWGLRRLVRPLPWDGGPVEEEREGQGEQHAYAEEPTIAHLCLEVRGTSALPTGTTVFALWNAWIAAGDPRTNCDS